LRLRTATRLTTRDDSSRGERDEETGRDAVADALHKNPSIGIAGSPCERFRRAPRRADDDLRVVSCGDCVGVLPFVDRSTVLLVRQYRYVAGRATWEMPTGGVHQGETSRRRPNVSSPRRQGIEPGV